MKRKFTILTAAIALLAFLAIPMGMRGQTQYTLTISASDFNTTSYAANNNEKTSNAVEINGSGTYEVNWTSYQVMKNGNNMQWQKNKGYIYNSTDLGTINSVTVNSSAGTFTTYYGTTEHPTSGTTVGNGFFTTAVGNATGTTSSVVITFTIAGGTTPTCATPTFSPAGGTYTQAQNVSISCATDGATIYYTTNGDDPTTSSSVYSATLTISETTTVKAMAAADGYNNSSVASATYTITTPSTIAEVRAQGTGSVFTQGIVTSCVGTTGYIQDATAAICVYGTSLTVGDEITVSGTLSTYNGLLEITSPVVNVVSSGNTVNPELMTIAEINASTNQGWYIRIEGATVTNISVSGNSQNTTIAQGNNTVVVRGNLGTTVAVNDIISLNGNIGAYNGVQIANPQNVEVQQNLEPSVTVTPNTINAPAEGEVGALSLTYENITDFISFDYYFCDAEGEELQEDPDWIYAEINPGADDTYILDYRIDANNGEARTAYMKVYTFDDEEEVYAIVTVNQEEYVAPTYAELPFEFDGGHAAIENTDGLYQEGLGSDYNSSPKLKFDGAGDWLLLQFQERPGTLTFDIKGNGAGSDPWEGVFKVMVSNNGSTFVEKAVYETGDLTSTKTTMTIDDLASDVRYIKWVYTTKTKGNVALGNINLAAYQTPVASITVNPATVNVDATPAEGEDFIEGTLDLTWENLEITDIWNDFAIQYYDAEGEELTDDPDWIVVEFATQDPNIGEGYLVSYMIDVNEGEARTAYFKVFALGEEDYVYSNLVTITQAAPEAPATPGTWVLTSLADLTEDDIFVIVGNNGDTYAMSNDKGTQHAPSTVAVTVTEGTLSGEPDANIQWNLEITDGGYIFHPNGTTETWLYCTNDNNGVRVGTGDAKHFTFDETYGDGYLTTTETTDQRWIGIYNSQDWRCYKLGTNGGFPSNIAGQTFSFYKKVYTLDITGYGESAGGYYLIASPVTVNPANVEGMTEGHFDLFRFNESADYEWENWKVEGDHYHFNLVPGQGYLYAHKTDVTLTFTGTPYNGESIILSKTDGNGIDWPGWNLVGNPYGVMAYLDRDFYTMNDAGDEIVAATNNSVQVMEGVFVIANSNGEELTFSTEAPAASGEKIVVNVSNTNGKLLDRAMIRFGEGGQLPKFQINENSTKLYINEGEEEFAVVRCINESSTPVSFRAAENGTYTLSINTENVEMEYLHLIDNLTGADIDLLATPSYTFESNTTDNVDRFAVVYTATTSVNENNAKPFAFFNGSEWVIMNEGNATMQVVDVTGRVISTETLNGNATINLIQVPGVYMIRLVNGNDVKVQKVVVK